MDSLDDIPLDWEGLQKKAQESISTLEKVLKVKLPGSIHDAVNGDFLEGGEKVLEGLLGKTSRKEKQEWKTRVIRLSDANDILATLESGIVKAYVLSAASPGRTMLDAVLSLPKWFVRHSAEIYFVLAPLIVAAGSQLADVVEIENRIHEKENEITFRERRMSNLYALTPARPGVQKRAPDNYTAGEIIPQILAEEKAIAKLQQQIADLEKLSIRASRWLGWALDAFAVVVTFLILAPLINAAKAAFTGKLILSPVRDLRDAAIGKAKVKALPQFPEKRTVVQKRSRRN